MHCRTEDSEKSEIPIREHSIQSVLWQQNAAEYKALTYQAYHLARLQLDKMLVKININKSNPAIITDIDETVLDNSPFNGKLIELDQNYSPELWMQWGNLASADTIPGALGFFQYAADRGIKIFYISNRFDQQKQITIENLKRYNFPFADDKHVLLKTGSSEKETRRQTVADKHKIIMLLGDNLSDFTSLFDKQDTARRNQLVDSLKSSFGSRFIVFPNPMYGDWETKGLYEGRYDWSPQQADSIRHLKIRSY
jgi:5'-nucleotidase (lipoprotein e(P4) family)